MVQENCLKQKIVVLTGPTAIGKSEIAVSLAEEFNCEIISADSMQIYRGLNIGTGKITEKETRGIKHYLIDVVEPDQNYSVSDFVKSATKCIDDISSRGKLPLIVGGTGFYINGLINGYNFSTTARDDVVRNKWLKYYNDFGCVALHDCLKKIDPVSAGQIEVNDVKRTIRALEIYDVTGKTKNEVVTADNKYDVLFIALTNERSVIYDRINRRVDAMFNNGLVDEVNKFKHLSDCQSMQAIGYKEVIPYLNGEMSLSDTIELVKKNSRNYAKRQITFIKWIKNVEKNFINNQDIDKIKELMRNLI